jgi:hypothetical protein
VKAIEDDAEDVPQEQFQIEAGVDHTQNKKGFISNYGI